MQTPNRILTPLVILFIIFTVIFLITTGLLKSAGLDPYVLLIANGVLFLLSMVSFFIQRKGLQSVNPHVFVRSVMGGMIIKMMIIIVALIVYLFASGIDFNKRTVFASLFLYIIYLVTEVTVVMKMNKKTNA